MALTREEVEHIARLARLELSEEELERFQRQLSDVLDYAARLGELDTRDIPPTSAVSAAAARLPVSALRPDEPGASLPREILLQNAPWVQDGQFRVPPVIEESRDRPG